MWRNAPLRTAPADQSALVPSDIERGRRVATRRLADAQETALSGYTEAHWQPVEPLTITGGAIRPRPVRSIGRVLNRFATGRADADYFYASRLPGEPLKGVEGINRRPVEPRQVRLGIKLAP